MYGVIKRKYMYFRKFFSNDNVYARGATWQK